MAKNLGHDNCLTTFSSYGKIPPAQQGEICAVSRNRGWHLRTPVALDLLQKLAEQLGRAGASA